MSGEALVAGAVLLTGVLGGVIGWLVSRSASKAPDPVGVAVAKQQALEPVQRDIQRADTPKKVADLWNDAYKP